MNATKLLVALLGLSTAATWGPQVWSAYGGDDALQEVFPDADEVGAGSAVKHASSAFPLAQEASAGVAAAGDSAAPDQDLPQADSEGSGEVPVQQLLSVLETFRGGSAGELSQLLETTPTWLDGQGGSGSSSRPRPDSRLSSGMNGTSSLADKRSRRDRVAAFTESASLTAIVNAEQGSWALLGGHIVQAGDVLIPELLWVETIGRRGVTLMSEEGRIELPLPAFRANSPRSGTTPEAAGTELVPDLDPPMTPDTDDSLEVDPA